MQAGPCAEDCEVDRCRSKHVGGRSKHAHTMSRMNFTHAVIAPVGLLLRSCTGQDVQHVHVWIHDKTGIQIDFRSVQIYNERLHLRFHKLLYRQLTVAGSAPHKEQDSTVYDATTMQQASTVYRVTTMQQADSRSHLHKPMFISLPVLSLCTFMRYLRSLSRAESRPV